MGNIFAGSEIIEIGIQIEKNGQEFYSSVSQHSKSQKAKELFDFLAAEEGNHIRVFQEILKKATKYEPQGIDSGDYFAYMNALASEHVFTKKDKGAQVAQSIAGDREAIEKAIGFEKDSIVFYEGMRKVVPGYDQKIVDALIAQEQSHLKQLVGLRRVI
jgi:rubrerythrin